MYNLDLRAVKLFLFLLIKLVEYCIAHLSRMYARRPWEVPSWTDYVLGKSSTHIPGTTSPTHLTCCSLALFHSGGVVSLHCSWVRFQVAPLPTAYTTGLLQLSIEGNEFWKCSLGGCYLREPLETRSAWCTSIYTTLLDAYNYYLPLDVDPPTEPSEEWSSCNRRSFGISLRLVNVAQEVNWD